MFPKWLSPPKKLRVKRAAYTVTVADILIPEFPAIMRLRFKLAPRSHRGFGFSCSIETAAAKGLQKPESMHQR